VDDALLAELDEYLRDCPDPDKVTPAWLVKKASRLLWRCRAALSGVSAPVGGDEARSEIASELKVLDNVTAHDNGSDDLGCAEIALNRALAALTPATTPSGEDQP